MSLSHQLTILQASFNSALQDKEAFSKRVANLEAACFVDYTDLDFYIDVVIQQEVLLFVLVGGMGENQEEMEVVLNIARNVNVLQRESDDALTQIVSLQVVKSSTKVMESSRMKKLEAKNVKLRTERDEFQCHFQALIDD